jgi:glycosyltransferase involved in cell wall biosynthesis
MPAYYVQDYEPWFICNPFECTYKTQAVVTVDAQHYKYSLSTYSAVNGKVFLFAKTDWIKDKVESNHPGTHVHRVTPSIDHSVYFADKGALAAKERVAQKLPVSLKAMSAFMPRSWAVPEGDKVKVIAMLRPRTPRRNSLTCFETLLKLAHEHQHVVQVSFFGVDETQLASMLTVLIKEYGHARHRNTKQVEALGLLKQRHELARLYRNSDLFVDMSWWQAFGRTAVEAMACGCVPIMPGEGAGSYVCDGGRVCRYHDGTDVAGYYDEVVSMVYNHTERLRMVAAGMERAKEFSITRAASSIEGALTHGVVKYRKQSLTS